MRQLELDIWDCSASGKTSAASFVSSREILKRSIGGGATDSQPPVSPFAKGDNAVSIAPELENASTTAPVLANERLRNAAALRELLRQKWPEAGYVDQFDPRSCFRVQLEQLRTVFPDKGIPYGQLLEITGGTSSGKTGLLLRTLAALTPAARIVYVDCAGMFFPPAAVAAGIDPEQILLLRHEHIDEAIRGVELLLEAKLVNCVAFDLAGVHETLPRILLHRLRQQIVRAKALAFFLTNDTAHLLPASLISLQLTVRKLNRQTLEVTATRSRINNEGAKGRLTLEAA